MPDNFLLESGLAAAVALWALKIKREAWPADKRRERASICAQYVAECGDNILFKSKKVGLTAEAFNRLAEGVALLSLVPGGVKCFGQTFDFSEY